MTTPCHCDYTVYGFILQGKFTQAGESSSTQLQWHCCMTVERPRKSGCAYIVQHSILLYVLLWSIVLFCLLVERHCVLWHFLLLQHKLECPAVRQGHVSGKPSFPFNASLMQQQQQHNGLHSVDLQGKAGQPKQNEAMARAHLELMVS